MNSKDSRSNSDNVTMPQKYLDKIVKMQQDQEIARQQEFELLRAHLAQMNVLLDELIKISGSGSTVAATKKLIPFQTGSQEVVQQLVAPNNPDDYITRIDVYKINDNRTVPHMTLINDGPGDIFFISAYSNNQFNSKEEHLNVNDQRELFNVYEIRLRASLPLTSVRLIEGIFRTGSTGTQTVINVVQKPNIQDNQILKQFVIRFDLNLPITISSPTVQNFAVNDTLGLTNQAPLPPGQTATLIDVTSNTPMPFTIPEGFLFETFSISCNMSTDFTIRSYLEVYSSPITNPTNPIFSRVPNFPASARGAPINHILNLSFPFATTSPALPGGQRVLITITNDDPFNDMIGVFTDVTILTRVI
jgi:hypothetical protein